MKHRLTPVQRKVLRWMRAADGQVRIETGHKTTTIVEGDYDNQIVLCQSLVQYFLIHHGYIERADGIATYRLTEKGRAA